MGGAQGTWRPCLSGASPPPAGWWTCSGGPAAHRSKSGHVQSSREGSVAWGKPLPTLYWRPVGSRAEWKGQGPLPALPALASPRCLGAWVPGAARIATFPRGRGRGCPGRLAVSTELASASWGWLGELVPSTRSCLQRPAPQAVCVLLREPQKLLERWAWPGAIFLLQSPWEGSRAPLRTARLSQHRRSLCPASEARTAACMGSWAPVLGSQSWWG